MSQRQPRSPRHGDDGGEFTAHIFVIFADPARLAHLDLTAILG